MGRGKKPKKPAELLDAYVREVEWFSIRSFHRGRVRVNRINVAISFWKPRFRRLVLCLKSPIYFLCYGPDNRFLVSLLIFEQNIPHYILVADARRVSFAKRKYFIFVQTRAWRNAQCYSAVSVT